MKKKNPLSNFLKGSRKQVSKLGKKNLQKRKESTVAKEGTNPNILLSSVPLLAVYHYNQGKNNCKRFVAAFLCVDIEGFTKFVFDTKNDLDTVKETASNYFATIVNVIKEFNGDIVKFTGDGFQVVWRCCEWSETNELIASEDRMRLAKERAIRNAARCAIKLTTSADLNKFVIRTGLSYGEILGMITNYQFGYGNTNKHKAAKKDQKIRKEYFILGETIDEGNECEKAYKAYRKNGGNRAGVVMTAAFHDLHFPDINHSGFHFNPLQTEIVSEGEENLNFYFCTNVDDMINDYHICNTKTVDEEKAERCMSSNALKLVAPFTHELIRAGTNASTSQTNHFFSVCVFICLNIEISFKNSESIDIDPHGFIRGIDNEQDIALHNIFTICFNNISKALREKRGLLRQFISDDKGIVAICTFTNKNKETVTRNAARASQYIQSAMFESTLRGTMHARGVSVSTSIGMSLGEPQSMWFGMIGAENVRQEFMVLGRPVLIAARLMALEQRENEIRCYNFSDSLPDYFDNRFFSNEGIKTEDLNNIGNTDYQLFQLQQNKFLDEPKQKIYQYFLL